jgi:hypothetical protein
MPAPASPVDPPLPELELAPLPLLLELAPLLELELEEAPLLAPLAVLAVLPLAPLLVEAVLAAAVEPVDELVDAAAEEVAVVELPPVEPAAEVLVELELLPAVEVECEPEEEDDEECAPVVDEAAVVVAPPVLLALVVVPPSAFHRSPRAKRAPSLYRWRSACGPSGSAGAPAAAEPGDQTIPPGASQDRKSLFAWT